MTTLQDLEAARDRTAGQVATLQAQLDELSGAEELTSVQRMLADLDAASRLLAAQDRTLAQRYEAQRAEAYAAREQRRQLAATQAAQIRGKLQAQLYPMHELTEQLKKAVEEFPEQYASATQLQLQLIGFMRACGIDVAVGIGTGVVPVRK